MKFAITTTRTIAEQLLKDTTVKLQTISITQQFLFQFYAMEGMCFNLSSVYEQCDRDILKMFLYNFKLSQNFFLFIEEKGRKIKMG